MNGARRRPATHTVRLRGNLCRPYADRPGSSTPWAVTRDRGEWMDNYDALYGPVGSDGYPVPVWNHRSGDIDPKVVAYWRANGADLRAYLEANWPRIAPALNGKLHFAVGEMDNYFLNCGLYLLQDFLEHARDPAISASFKYGRPMVGHSFVGVGYDPFPIGLLEDIAATIAKHHRRAPIRAGLLVEFARSTRMKTSVRVLVIGGGVVGCSVIYHLTKLGWSDVALCERKELTSGSSWHAAGLFHALNTDAAMCRLQAYTVALLPGAGKNFRPIDRSSLHGRPQRRRHRRALGPVAGGQCTAQSTRAGHRTHLAR